MKSLAPLSSLAFVVVVVGGSIVVGCTTPTPPGAEGESGEGEGEGEGEGDLGPIDVGPLIQGYSATKPSTFGDAKCSTEQFWTLGDHESEVMHPGYDCITCHAQNGGPRLDVAGTIMGRKDDGEDCRGVPDVQIEIFASDGTSAGKFPSNEAGNFFATGDVSAIAPYTVTLTFEGRTSQMLTPQTDGNCMSCHTVEGKNGAPGRIVAP